MVEQFTDDDFREMVLRLGHEIRNPLATIQSAVQLIERLTQPQDEISEYLEGVLAEVDRLDHIVRDLQQYIRIEPCQPQVVEVLDVATAVALECRPEAERAGTIIDVASGPPLRVLAEPRQLSLALTELVLNALRFAPRGSTVFVRWSTGDSGEVDLEVEDQGPGVAEDRADRILRPFFSTSTRGTGLGLNKVQRVARLNGGRLQWENQQPGGGRFTITLRQA